MPCYVIVQKPTCYVLVQKTTCHVMYLFTGPRVQTNTATAYIDGNFLYGNNVRLAEDLRLLKGGRLKTLPAFAELGLKDLMPLKLQFPDDGCIRNTPDIYCFLAGQYTYRARLAFLCFIT